MSEYESSRGTLAKTGNALPEASLSYSNVKVFMLQVAIGCRIVAKQGRGEKLPPLLLRSGLGKKTVRWVCLSTGQREKRNVTRRNCVLGVLPWCFC